MASARPGWRRRSAPNIIERFPGGVWWVDLAPLRDGAAIGSTLLAAIGASEDGSRPALHVARDRLSTGAALVVFDNCEHLVADAAAVIDELRAGCPSLVVLATSREPLGLAGEVTWRVPSLAVPPPGADLEHVDGYDAITLFLDRARRARSDLRLDVVQMAAVVETCREVRASVATRHPFGGVVDDRERPNHLHGRRLCSSSRRVVDGPLRDWYGALPCSQPKVTIIIVSGPCSSGPSPRARSRRSDRAWHSTPTTCSRPYRR